MKTELEYTELFLKFGPQTCESSEELKYISVHYWNDLTSHLGFYFDHEVREQITIKAAQQLKQNISEGSDLKSAWVTVIRNFLANNYWGFKSTSVKPIKKQTEEQKIFWKLFKYAWAFFQSMVILKIAVYYFGLESAQNPDQTSVVWVWFFFFLSVGSLAFFAYRNRNDSN